MNQTIGIASDHAGFEMKEYLKKYLSRLGYKVTDFGTDSQKSCDYADFAHPLALAVESGEVSVGVAMCGSGNGINMTLNKHQGIRAALCWNEEIAKLARQHNDANVLVLPARFISESEAETFVKAFLNEKFEGGRHQCRIDKMKL